LLTVRALGNDLSLSDFSFSDHGKTFAVDIEDETRQTLRLGK